MKYYWTVHNFFNGVPGSEDCVRMCVHACVCVCVVLYTSVCVCACMRVHAVLTFSATVK